MRFTPLAGLAISLTAALPALAQPVPDEPLRYIDELPAAPGSPAARAGVPTTWPQPAKAPPPKPKLVETAGGVAGGLVGQTLEPRSADRSAGSRPAWSATAWGPARSRWSRRSSTPARKAQPAVEQASAAPDTAKDASATAPAPQGEVFKVRGEPDPDPPPEAEPQPARAPS